MEALRDFLVRYQNQPNKFDENSIEILKKIQVICSRLPTMDPGSFKEEFDEQLNDGLLTLCLSMMTKTEAGLRDTNSLFGLYKQEISTKKKSRGASHSSMPGFSPFKDRGGRRFMH